jgi:Skp family chaperone for outer membrane proteins
MDSIFGSIKTNLGRWSFVALVGLSSSHVYAGMVFVDTQRILNESPQAKQLMSQNFVVEAANKAIRNFAELNHIDFVFQEVVFASDSVNVTDKILEVLVNPGSVSPIALRPTYAFIAVNPILDAAREIWGSDKSTSFLIEKANESIKVYANSAGIDLVFQDAVYASEAIAITKDVISAMRGELVNRKNEVAVWQSGRVVFVETQRVLRESPTARQGGAQRLVIERANAAINKISVTRGIHLIFQNAVYASSKVDLTDDLLRALD